LPDDGDPNEQDSAAYRQGQMDSGGRVPTHRRRPEQPKRRGERWDEEYVPPEPSPEERRMPREKRKQIGAGALKSTFDGAAVVVSPATRTNRLWKPHGETMNQGNTDHCCGWTAYRVALCEPTARKPEISPAQIFDLAQTKYDSRAGTNYFGTSLYATFKALVEEGCFKGQGRIYDHNALINYLLNVGPVGMAVDWTQGMVTPHKASDGEYYIRPKIGSVQFGHATTLHGTDRYHPNFDGTEGAHRVWTSWGTWGYYGRAWITYRDMQDAIANGISGDKPEFHTASE
jgi:hypothetical protein